MLHPRASAQMLKTDAAPTWNFRVLNNTNADALYVLDGAAFNSGTANSTRNLRAPTRLERDELHANARRSAVRDSRHGLSGEAARCSALQPTTAFPALESVLERRATGHRSRSVLSRRRRHRHLVLHRRRARSDRVTARPRPLARRHLHPRRLTPAATATPTNSISTSSRTSSVTTSKISSRAPIRSAAHHGAATGSICASRSAKAGATRIRRWR